MVVDKDIDLLESYYMINVKLYGNEGKIPNSVLQYVLSTTNEILKRHCILYMLMLHEAFIGCCDKQWYCYFEQEKYFLLKRLMSCQSFHDLRPYICSDIEEDIHLQKQIGYSNEYMNKYSFTLEKLRSDLSKDKGKMPIRLFNFFDACQDEVVKQDLIEWLIPSLEAFQKCCKYKWYWFIDDKMPSMVREIFSCQNYLKLEKMLSV